MAGNTYESILMNMLWWLLLSKLDFVVVIQIFDNFSISSCLRQYLREYFKFNVRVSLNFLHAKSKEIKKNGRKNICCINKKQEEAFVAVIFFIYSQVSVLKETKLLKSFKQKNKKKRRKKHKKLWTKKFVNLFKTVSKHCSLLSSQHCYMATLATKPLMNK